MSEKKVGQEFCRCYPTNMWIGDYVEVNIDYTEYKITKINEESIRVAKKLEDGKWSRDNNWKNGIEESYHTKEKVLELVKKNSPILLKQYNKVLEKYTKKAFEYWYLKGQIRIIEIIFNLAQTESLNYIGIKSMQKTIKKENDFLQRKLKELKKIE